MNRNSTVATLVAAAISVALSGCETPDAQHQVANLSSAPVWAQTLPRVTLPAAKGTIHAYATEPGGWSYRVPAQPGAKLHVQLQMLERAPDEPLRLAVVQERGEPVELSGDQPELGYTVTDAGETFIAFRHEGAPGHNHRFRVHITCEGSAEQCPRDVQPPGCYAGDGILVHGNVTAMKLDWHHFCYVDLIDTFSAEHWLAIDQGTTVRSFAPDGVGPAINACGHLEITGTEAEPVRFMGHPATDAWLGVQGYGGADISYTRFSRAVVALDFDRFGRESRQYWRHCPDFGLEHWDAQPTLRLTNVLVRHPQSIRRHLRQEFFETDRLAAVASGVHLDLYETLLFGAFPFAFGRASLRETMVKDEHGQNVYSNVDDIVIRDHEYTRL